MLGRDASASQCIQKKCIQTKCGLGFAARVRKVIVLADQVSAEITVPAYCRQPRHYPLVIACSASRAMSSSPPAYLHLFRKALGRRNQPLLRPWKGAHLRTQ